MTNAQGQVDLSILIVSYNTRDLLLDCIRSIRAQTSDIALRYEILVVDNCSSDGSPETVAVAFPGVRLIQPFKNLGFSAANNLAAREAAGEWLLLLNPDTVILDRAIERAWTFAQQHREAIIGGRTYFGDGRLNPTSCHGWPTLWGVTCQGLGLSSLLRRSRFFNPEGLGRWPRDTIRSVPVVTGCFLLVRRKIWENLKGFDESFFMYGEETDLCMRAARQGIARLIFPEARLVHYGGGSERVRVEKMIRLFRAKAALYRKHWGRPSAAYGIGMLKLWALSRYLGHGLLDRLGRTRGGSETWSEIWRRRREYAIEPGPAQEVVENQFVSITRSSHGS